MSDYGLDTRGFTPAPYAYIREQFVSQFIASLSQLAPLHSAIDTSDSSKLGRLISLFSTYVAEHWQLLQQIYLLQDPDSGDYDQLVRLAALTGTTPNDATPSTVSLLLGGELGTVVPAGALVRDAAKRQVQTLEPGTFAAAGPRISSTAYELLDVVTEDGLLYYCNGAGTTSASVISPFVSFDPEETTYADGSVEWKYCGEGVAYAYVEAEAATVGPLTFLAQTLTDIVSAQAGWTLAINPQDAALGTNAESYESLHVRRELDLARSAEGSPAAMRAALLDLDNVRGASVFVNRESYAVGGIPAKGVHVIVLGGDELDIANAIFDNGGLAPAYAGSTEVTLTTPEGNAHVVKFSRPTEVPIYVTFDLEVDAEEYTNTLADELAAAVLTWEATRRSGQNVRASALTAVAHDFPGVLGAIAKIGLSAAPSASTSIAIDTNEIATFDSTRIVVNVTEVTP